MRLVLFHNRTYAVYEGKKCIAAFVLEEDQRFLTPEEVEEIRTAEYKELA